MVLSASLPTVLWFVVLGMGGLSPLKRSQSVPQVRPPMARVVSYSAIELGVGTGIILAADPTAPVIFQGGFRGGMTLWGRYHVGGAMLMTIAQRVDQAKRTMLPALLVEVGYQPWKPWPLEVFVGFGGAFQLDGGPHGAPSTPFFPLFEVETTMMFDDSSMNSGIWTLLSDAKQSDTAPQKRELLDRTYRFDLGLSWTATARWFFFVERTPSIGVHMTYQGFFGLSGVLSWVVAGASLYWP